MEQQWFAGLIGLAFVTLFTPGPNNIMLAASGANFGLARSLPHMSGVALGFAALLVPTALGFGALLEIYPSARWALKIMGSAALLWLAWRIATSGRSHAKGGGRPLTFLEASAFQLVNPKAWIIAISVGAAYMTGTALWAEAAAAALVFATVGYASSTTWVLFGVGIRRFLANDRALRVFNWTMGALVALCVAPLFMVD